MRAGLAWFLIGLSLVSSGLAGDIHVDNLAGDDRSDGLDGPVATLAKALRLAQAGDRIVLASTGQPYRESVSLVGSKHSGSAIAPFVIEGDGAILDGRVSPPADAWNHHRADVFYLQPARLGYQQLFIAARPAVRHPKASSEVSLPELAPLEWCWCDARIYFRTEAQRLPSEYELSCCGLQSGITLYYVHDVVVRNLTIQGFCVDGICASDVVAGAEFERVTCRGNGRSGINVAGSSRVEVVDCALGNNGSAQLRSEGYSQTRVSGGKLLANTAPAISIQGGQITIDGHGAAVEAP